MAFYNLALQEIFLRLGTNPEKGLSEEKAAKRLDHDGPNELPRHKPKFWKVYLAPLFNWLIVIYLIGAVILFITGMLQTEVDTSSTLLYTTLFIVALNCIIAIIQPGGSIRDPEVIAAANEQGLSLLLTGIRHFKH